MGSITVNDLLRTGDRLGLSIEAGRRGLDRPIRKVSVRRIPPWTHSSKGEILLTEAKGFSDFEYLLPSIFHRCNIPCIIAPKGVSPHPKVRDEIENAAIPLLISRYGIDLMESRLVGFLRETMEFRTTLGGVLVTQSGKGILILGESGSGKSSCALELISRGGKLVADDVVDLRRKGVRCLFGTSPRVTRHLMEIRGHGIVNIKDWIGKQAVADGSSVDLVVKLVTEGCPESREKAVVTLLGIELPLFRISSASPADAARRIEKMIH